MKTVLLSNNFLFCVFKVDDSVSVNDIDLSLYIPRDVDETGITVASLERFSTYTSEKDGKYANLCVI